MNLYIIVVALIISAGAYIKGRIDGDELAHARDQRERDIAVIASANGQRGAAKAIAGIEIKHQVIKGQVERIIHENIVYRDCRHGADGLRVINAAITGRAEPAGDSKLPERDSAAGR